ncbi:lipoyltransferase and lipoate-protein ligase [Peptostreptococcaceae bacterium oral taxon 113 str. W5053]|nr:lipoyltransferase and lipoate-protein ligase [Peptostreptococcaceae bacterium oral taxon 113 str. W5053]
MIYIENNEHNPSYNLALEEFAFHHFIGENVFLLWMNSPVIVVGKNQNTLQEINMEYVRDNHIDVVRRLSGGGAVYHDLGNLNFTIITENNAPKVFDFQSFSQPVIHVLKDLGISASFSGRNDIQIDGQKFCGNAQYRNKGRVLHHGAMLFDVDLMVLSKALKVSEDKMASKGVASVRSHVTNIVEHLDHKISVEEFKTLLLDYMKKHHDLREYQLTEEDKNEIQSLMDKRYSNWDWNFGKSPKMDMERKRRYPAGSLDFSFCIREGKISDIHIYGDFFGSGEIKDFLSRFIHVPYRREDLRQVIEKEDIAYYFSNFSKEEILNAMID